MRKLYYKQSKKNKEYFYIYCDGFWYRISMYFVFDFYNVQVTSEDDKFIYYEGNCI